MVAEAGEVCVPSPKSQEYCSLPVKVVLYWVEIPALNNSGMVAGISPPIVWIGGDTSTPVTGSVRGTGVSSQPPPPQRERCV